MKNKFMLVLVNLLTAMRVFGVFMLIPIYFKCGGIYAALLAICCYLTDCIDGFLARKFHVSTFFGSMFDGIADKMFSCANLIILYNATKLSLGIILLEFIIVIIQFWKFQKNINIKTSQIGRIKTIVMSITVILLYLLIDIENFAILPLGIRNYISGIETSTLLGFLFIPLYIFEVLTLYSYLKFLKNPIVKEEKIDLKKINIKLKPKNSLKNRIYNFGALWLNNEFYENYKDSNVLKEIRKSVKKQPRI